LRLRKKKRQTDGDNDGSLLLQQKEAEFGMGAKREKKRELQ
jgi:hypothetical protein